MPKRTESSIDLQFAFKSNSIIFHPTATPDLYAICFFDVDDLNRTPRLLIAGDKRGVQKLVLYSIPETASDREFEFPGQL